MKQKTLTIIFGMILLVGLVAAANTLNNLDVTINIPANVIAGDTFTADFSFDYYDNLENEDNSPLIIKLNLTSNDQINYPVWKGDFELSGLIKRWWIVNWIPRETIPLSCYENSPLTINHPYGPTALNVSNGTFYCYNLQYNNLDLNEHDEVNLYLKSHQALYPGNYLMTAEFFYINDSESPIVNIINKNYFEITYFKVNKDIEIATTINENVGIYDYWATIFTGTQNFSVSDKHRSGELYYLSRTLPDIQEGNYKMKVFAEDTSGNIGEDTTTLMIDRTSPNIHAIQPHGSYHETIYIELNVTDEKSGVDNSSVKYRISEMIPGYGQCPEGGYGLGNLTCYDSGWLPTVYNSTTKHYHDEFNSSALPEGEYWFEAKAKDILGNEGVL